MPQIQQVRQIPLGYSLDTILRELVNVRNYYAQFPFIRRSALHYGNPAENNDLSGMLRRISDFVRDSVVYIPDPHGFELVVAPDVLLADILTKGRAHGDCDDHVLLLNTLLQSVGFETVFIGVKQDSEEYNHVISGVNIQGRWVDVDPCDKSERNMSYNDKYVVG